VNEVYAHRPVMCGQVLELIAPHAGGLYADATLGGGGHTRALLDASAPDGRVLAVDRDTMALEHASTWAPSYGARLTLVHGEFAELPELVEQHFAARLDGLVADLGVSSPQLDTPGRGFSLAHDGPLDMRMDLSRGESAKELLDRVEERELADLIFHYGEERRSRAIARSILRARQEGRLSTTFELRAAVVRASGPRRGKIDPATRTFQALRIAVNQELEQLEALLAALPELLADDGVAAVIAFHSLEDRLVKHALRGDARLTPLTRKPRLADDAELQDNPRARSAKLRAARRTSRELDLERERDHQEAMS